MISRLLFGCISRFLWSFDLESAFLDLHPLSFLNLQVDVQSLFVVEISENILQVCSSVGLEEFEAMLELDASYEWPAVI